MDATTLAEPVHGEVVMTEPKGQALSESRPAPAPMVDDGPSMVDPFIRRLVLDKSIDLDRLNAVRAMVRENEQETQRKAFNRAMVAVKAAIPIIVKNAENTDSKAKYATLDKIGAGVDHVLAENGITTSFYPLSGAREGHVRVECILAHVEGFERRVEVEVPVDAAGKNGTINKTPIHAWRSATTYARRTLYEMIFDVKSRIATPDDDGNAAGGKIPGLTQAQVDEIQGLVITTGTDPAKMLAGYKVERIEDLSLIQFGEVRILLEQKAAKQARAQKQPAERANAG